MSNKAIGDYALKATPEATDKYLLQGTDGLYKSITHVNLMMGMGRVVKTLTQAEIQAGATPVTLVTAQGSGTVIEPIDGSAAFIDHNGTTYATATNARLKHAGQSNLMMATSTSFVTATSDRYEMFVKTATSATNQQMFANTALVVDFNANATNNGGTITLDIMYIVKKFA